ncbi:MAG TPA: aminopeptidase [Solirubrobacteraceae bacterium]|nr:aminopeptidase [Solirubrobacteraceae bacterium]
MRRGWGPDPDAFAALLCDWCLEVKPGQQVLVAMPLRALPLVRALHVALLERDAWPVIRLSPAELAEDFYRHAREAHLDGFPSLDLLDVQTADAVVGIEAPSNTRALASTDPALIARAARARKPIQEARLALRWCGTIWPTPALAQQAGMGEREYAEFVTRALFLDRPDAIAAWRELSARQQRLVDRLSTAHEIHIEAPGTDLRLRVDGRTWINSNGKRNMPSGEVFTGPIEASAAGTIRFTIPSSPRGVEVSGVELTFDRGKVVKARADRGEDYLRSALAIDDGAAFLGELGIGTNTGIDRPTGAILLDEKMAGTVHLALGRSYPETGGTNVSALHWDLICDLREGGRMGVDGQVLNENGRFVE